MSISVPGVFYGFSVNEPLFGDSVFIDINRFYCMSLMENIICFFQIFFLIFTYVIGGGNEKGSVAV